MMDAKAAAAAGVEHPDGASDVAGFKLGARRAGEARGRKRGGGIVAYLRTTARPSVPTIAAYAREIGHSLETFLEQAIRHASGPWASVHRSARAVIKAEGRLLETLSKARSRAYEKPPAGLDIDALNEQRFRDPKAALKASFEALRLAGGKAEVAQVLAVHASNLRERDDLGSALQALWVGMPLAEAAELEDRQRFALIGWMLEAAGSVMHAAARGEFARLLIDEAEALFCRGQSRRGQVVAKLDRSGLLTNLHGDYQGAITEAAAALALAPSDRARLICGAQQALAAGYHGVGDLARASEEIEAASVRVPAGASMLLGRVRWMHGVILRDRGELAAAETLLGEAYDLIADPVCDRLMIAAQIIEVAARRGDHARAATLALGHLPRLAEPIHKEQRALEAAHGDLIRAAVQSRVSAAAIQGIIAKIADARKSRLRLAAMDDDGAVA